MTAIEVFADIMCPFTHVSLRRLVTERNRRKAHRPIRVRAWPLEWINGSPISRDLAAQEITALRSDLAPDLFTAFERAPYPRSSIPAFGLVAMGYALDDAIGEAVSLAVRDALFEAGRDVADDAVLREIGEPFDITPPDRRAAEAIVRVDWEIGIARGVLGSPHFFVDGRGWFCPTLDIRHDASGFDIALAPDALHDFYASIFDNHSGVATTTG